MRGGRGGEHNGEGVQRGGVGVGEVIPGLHVAVDKDEGRVACARRASHKIELTFCVCGGGRNGKRSEQEEEGGRVKQVQKLN